jgi:hypothetical protein
MEKAVGAGRINERSKEPELLDDFEQIRHATAPRILRSIIAHFPCVASHPGRRN